MRKLHPLPLLGALALLAFRPATTAGQEAVAPWASGLPGLEHPAAWGLGSGRVAAGVQHAERWTQGRDAFHTQWVGCGWRMGNAPQARRGARWTLGWSSMLDRQASGWTEGRHLIEGAVQIPLDKGWNGAAGLGVGLAHWTLDGREWSWDAQYGPAGYNPGAPTGEPDGLTSGGSWNPEVTAGVAAERPARRGNAAPSLKAAATLHHALRPIQPHFFPIAADTTSRRLSWWVESEGKLGRETLTWRAWHRGSLQGAAAWTEIGGSIGRTFGSASRYTRDAQSHDVHIGLLFRSDGILRLPVTWRHGGITCWIAPGLPTGHRSPAATGWAAAIAWSPVRDGVTPLASR